MSSKVKFRLWDIEGRVMMPVTSINIEVGYVWGVQGTTKSSHWFDECKLMQFTGIKDKNDVEIYEGDIVKFDARSHYHPEVYAWEYETEGVGIIRYEMGSYVLGGREKTHILESLFGILMNYEEIEIEVIGN